MLSFVPPVFYYHYYILVIVVLLSIGIFTILSSCLLILSYHCPLIALHMGNDRAVQARACNNLSDKYPVMMLGKRHKYEKAKLANQVK